MNKKNQNLTPSEFALSIFETLLGPKATTALSKAFDDLKEKDPNDTTPYIVNITIGGDQENKRQLRPSENEAEIMVDSMIQPAIMENENPVQLNLEDTIDAYVSEELNENSREMTVAERIKAEQLRKNSDKETINAKIKFVADFMMHKINSSQYDFLTTDENAQGAGIAISCIFPAEVLKTFRSQLDVEIIKAASAEVKKEQGWSRIEYKIHDENEKKDHEVIDFRLLY